MVFTKNEANFHNKRSHYLMIFHKAHSDNPLSNEILSNTFVDRTSLRASNRTQEEQILFKQTEEVSAKHFSI